MYHGTREHSAVLPLLFTTGDYVFNLPTRLKLCYSALNNIRHTGGHLDDHAHVSGRNARGYRFQNRLPDRIDGCSGIFVF